MSESNWISVEDELPENNVMVLTTGFDYGIETNDRHYAVAVCINNYWYDLEDPDVEYTYITHWQPLPQPPVSK